MKDRKQDIDMKGECIDSGNLKVLEEGKIYYLFPNGSGTFYASKFNNEKAHCGSFNQERFNIIEEIKEEPQKEETSSKLDQYEQLSLFEMETDGQSTDNTGHSILIPQDVVSPLECKHGLKTKAFRKEQSRFSSYVKSIQDHHKIDWFKARKLFFQHRDTQKEINVAFITE